MSSQLFHKLPNSLVRAACSAITIISFFCAGHAYAESVDCDNAHSPMEKLICSDLDLSRLDEDLNDRYLELLKEMQKQKIKQGRPEVTLRTQQRKWLKETRETCADTACLKEAFAGRIKVFNDKLTALEPLGDKNVTCEEMQKYPDRIFAEGIDLGSGSGSPNNFDYRCKENIKIWPSFKPLMHLAETIRQDGGPCTGTIIYAQARYYSYELTGFGIAPDSIMKQLKRRKYWQQRKPAVEKYFKYWSHQSFTNWQLYKEFYQESAKVRPQLIRYYETHFGFSRKKARMLTENALTLILSRAACCGGTYEDVPLTEVTSNPKSTIRDVEREMGGWPKDEAFQLKVYHALKVALLYEKPMPYLMVLIKALGGQIDDSLNEAETAHLYETPLFFALGNHRNVEMLLKHGAQVDYANEFGKTPLFYAIGLGDGVLAEMLIKYGADVNHPYSSAAELNPGGEEYTCGLSQIRHTRRTPLMHAAQNSDIEMMKLLLKYGAKLDSVDELNFNAANYAVQDKKTENARFLESLGLKPNKDTLYEVKVHHG